MATLLKVLNNLADTKSAGGVALRVRTQEAQIAVNITGQETLRSVGSPKRREGLLTIRGYVTIAHIIVLAGCWYLLSFLAKSSDEAGILGIKWLIGYFLLAEFIFTNNWLVARAEHRTGYPYRSEESISSMRKSTPLSDATGHPTALAVETSQPKWDGLSPEQETTVTRAMKEALGAGKLKVVDSYASRPSMLSRKTRAILIASTLAALLLLGWIAKYEWLSQTACTERALTAKELILVEGKPEFSDVSDGNLFINFYNGNERTSVTHGKITFAQSSSAGLTRKDRGPISAHSCWATTATASSSMRAA